MKIAAVRRLVVTVSLLLAVESNSAPAEPLNLLFILTDNQSASLLGAYGNPEVRTPNIDRLAEQGTLFTQAFAVNGMCSPTRATLMTGLMPSQHGLHDWLDDEMLHTWPGDWSAVAEFRTLPLTLANRGYQTAMIGKWHLGQPWQPSLGYQHWVTFTDGHTVDFWDNHVIDNGEQYAVKDRHIVDFFAERAVDYLNQVDKSRPFYLQLNFDGPYLNPPTNFGPARNRHYQSYLDSPFQSFPRNAYSKNLIDQMLDPESPEFLRRMLILGLQMHNDRATMANVASQNTIVDDGVGTVLQALEANGLADNTLVVFSTDQGNFYGQYGLWEHTVVTRPTNLYEVAMRIPLIIRQPDGRGAGSRRDELIGQYDLPVTLLDYLGFGDVELESSPGRSFSALLKGADGAWHNEVYYEMEETRGVRTPEYAYWQRLEGLGEPELYDMQRDPEQRNNLANQPQYQAQIDALRSKLERFFAVYSDPAYDLWRGGVAKGSVVRPGLFKQKWGEQWAPESEIKPPFVE